MLDRPGKSEEPDEPEPDEPFEGARPGRNGSMNTRRLTVVRWFLGAAGVVLIALTLGAAGYARFAGQQVEDGLNLPKGPHYLVATGGIARCTPQPGGVPIEIQPLGARELLDGARIDPPTESRLTCTGGDVRVTGGAVLIAYPLAEYDYFPVLAGAALIMVARHVLPRRGKAS